MFKRVVFVLISFTLISIALNIQIAVDFGFNPYNTFAQAFKQIFNIELVGNSILITQFIIFIGLIIYYIVKKRKIKKIIPTIFAIFILTRFINYFNFIIDFEVFQTLRITMFTLSILLFALGVFFMSKANLFIPPYDKFIMEISEVINKKAAHSRLICDIIVLVLAVLLGIVFNVGITLTIATIIITFSVGTVVNRINKIYCRFSSDPYCKLV